MTVYGITRAGTRKQQAAPEVQAKMIRRHFAAVQLPEPTILDEPLKPAIADGGDSACCPGQKGTGLPDRCLAMPGLVALQE